MKKLVQLIIFLFITASVIAQDNLFIADLQMNVSDSISENERTLIQHLKSLKDKNVDFLITPEGPLLAYNSTFDGQELKEALTRVIDVAKNLNIGLILGACYKDAVKGKEYCSIRQGSIWPMVLFQEQLTRLNRQPRNQ